MQLTYVSRIQSYKERQNFFQPESAPERSRKDSERAVTIERFCSL